MSLKLVAGLGNPGAEYERTPHNVGFRVVNRVAELASASWRDEPKFKGSVARIRFQGAEALLLKPLTDMNLRFIPAPPATTRKWATLPNKAQIQASQSMN